MSALDKHNLNYTLISITLVNTMFYVLVALRVEPTVGRSRVGKVGTGNV